MAARDEKTDGPITENGGDERKRRRKET